ncbi:MAG: hypothetical protein V7642_806, partial [Burkholderiales bacterium]
QAGSHRALNKTFDLYIDIGPA